MALGLLLTRVGLPRDSFNKGGYHNALAGCSMEANIDDDTLCGAVELRKAVGELMLILAFVTAITVVFVTAFVEETAGSDLEALDRRYCCLPSCVPRAKPPQPR